MDFSRIKLVIWDLDETFWKGVLSDHTVSVIEENIELIKNMTDAGVINSICSKNDPRQVTEFLEGLGIWNLFVFPSVNWSPKGERVDQIVQQMNLRSVNVLFLDDNNTNRAEVASVCQGILTANIDLLPELQDYYRSAPKTDRSHSRLEQYRVLERKTAFKATIGSNQEFLRKCNIRVDIRRDCDNHTERLAELIQRSNQLNFTKVRSSADELTALFRDPTVDCGYVEVKDNFGLYGIVGFFAKKENNLIHYVFSCRTLNMGVEQYVYHYLGCPRVEIVGDVSSSLEDPCPDWINQEKTYQSHAAKTAAKGIIVIKGPCDMQLMFSFMKETKNIHTEFVYVNNRGISIEQGNHTTHIVESKTLDDNTKNRLAHDLPFGDRGMFRTAVYDPSVQWILLSMLTDANLGVYREKTTGAMVAFGEYTNDLTDEANWSKLMNKELFTANCVFTAEQLKRIRSDYDYCGRLEPEQVMNNLRFIYDHIAPSANLVLFLGSELPYENNTQPAYRDRHLYHRSINQLIREWAAVTARVFILDANQYVKNQTDYSNNINHFTKEVYYKMTQDFLNMVNSSGQTVLYSSTDREKKRSRLIKNVKKIPNKLIRMLHGK